MNSYSLSFSHRLDYSRGKAIEFTIELISNLKMGVFVDVKLDTCIEDLIKD